MSNTKSILECLELRYLIYHYHSRQSPIDILPSELLYDPSLPEFSLTPNKVSGRVVNTGHTVTFQVTTRH